MTDTTVAVRPPDAKPDRKRRDLMPYWLILPSVVFLAAIVGYPLVVGLLEGFRYHNRLQPWLTRFNGLENYVQAFHDNQVWNALRVSFVMVVGIVALSYVLGLVAALLLNQKFKLRGVYRALILVPWVEVVGRPASGGADRARDRQSDGRHRRGAQDRFRPGNSGRHL